MITKKNVHCSLVSCANFAIFRSVENLKINFEIAIIPTFIERRKKRVKHIFESIRNISDIHDSLARYLFSQIWTSLIIRLSTFHRASYSSILVSLNAVLWLEVISEELKNPPGCSLSVSWITVEVNFSIKLSVHRAFVDVFPQLWKKIFPRYKF